MSKVVNVVVGVVAGVAGVLTGNFALIATGLSLVGGAIFAPKVPKTERTAIAAQMQLGETPRGAGLGRFATEGSLVDAFNHGGKYGTDWEVLVIALADHECDALQGFYVNDTFHAFTGDGAVAGFNGQLEVYWKSGTWDQAASSYLTANGPGWTANDRGRSVCYVVAAYKADEQDQDNPVWAGRRPNFKWVLRGLKCYQARLDSSVGGSGSHRRDDPSTWQWTENLIDARYNWVRGIYAGNQVAQPEMLLIGRGLSALEAPPENVFARANLCDEIVDGEPRYRVGGMVYSNESFEDVEDAFATACAGVVVQREGSVEIDPGEAKPIVAHFTDGDFIKETKVTWSDFLGDNDRDWVNTVVGRFPDPDQQWNERSAPVQRNTSDIVADGGPREATISLGLAPFGKQAQRVAEITRRLGRIWGRGVVTLPPQFAEVEEGDWVQWTSARRFGGQTKTFQVRAYGSDEGWRHQLTLREIDASVYSDGPALADGAVANPNAPPPALIQPGAGTWASTGTTIAGASGSVPAVQVQGAVDDAYAQRIRIEYRKAGDPDWEIWGEFGRNLTKTAITGIADKTEYEVAMSYLVADRWTPRRELAAVTTGAIATSSGALTIISRSVAFPLSSNDDSISIAAFNAVLNDGSSISFAADSIPSLTAGTSYAVFWDTVNTAYLAAASPALTQMADRSLVLIGTQSTSSGGTYTPPPSPPDGGGGDGTHPY